MSLSESIIYGDCLDTDLILNDQCSDKIYGTVSYVYDESVETRNIPLNTYSIVGTPQIETHTTYGIGLSTPDKLNKTDYIEYLITETNPIKTVNFEISGFHSEPGSGYGYMYIEIKYSDGKPNKELARLIDSSAYVSNGQSLYINGEEIYSGEIIDEENRQVSVDLIDEEGENIYSIAHYGSAWDNNRWTYKFAQDFSIDVHKDINLIPKTTPEDHQVFISYTGNTFLGNHFLGPKSVIIKQGRSSASFEIDIINRDKDDDIVLNVTAGSQYLNQCYPSTTTILSFSSFDELDCFEYNYITNRYHKDSCMANGFFWNPYFHRTATAKIIEPKD